MRDALSMRNAPIGCANVLFEPTHRTPMTSPRVFRSFIRSVLLSVLLSMLLCGVGCGDSPSAAPDIEVTDFRYVKLPDGEREFTGTVVNQGSKRYNVVQIDIALYGPDGSRTASQKIEVDDIPPDSNRSFRARVNADATIERARIQSILVP